MSEIYELNCPHCDRAYRLSRDKIEANAGKQIKCRACGQPFVLPGVDAAEAEQEYASTEPADSDTTETVHSDAPADESEPAVEATAYETSHQDAIAPTVEYEPEAAPATAPPPVRPTSPVAPAPAFTPPAPPMPRSAAPAPNDPAPQVIYAMPPQTVEDLATMRKAMSLWNILLIVMVVLQLIAAGSMLWIAVRLFR